MLYIIRTTHTNRTAFTFCLLQIAYNRFCEHIVQGTGMSSVAYLGGRGHWTTPSFLGVCEIFCHHCLNSAKFGQLILSIQPNR